MNDNTSLVSRRSVLRTSVALAGSAVVSSSANAQVARAGTARWTRQESTLGSNPVYASGRIFVVDGNGSLVCCDAKTGKDAWASGTGGKVNPYALAATTDTVVAGTEGGILSAFRASDGSKKWERSVSGEITSLQIADDTLLFGLDGAIGALNLSSGGVKWPTRDGYDTYAPLRAGVTNGTVVYASGRLSLRGISLDDGTSRWEQEIGNWSNEASTPGIAAEDGAVYVGGEYGGLLRIEASDGTVTWQKEFDDSEIESVHVAGENIVGVGNTVHVVSASTGRKQYSLGVNCYQTPALRDGELIVAGTTQSGNRAVLGVEVDGGMTNWRYSVDDNDWSSFSGVAAGPENAYFVDELEEVLTAVRRQDEEPTATPQETDTPHESPESTRSAADTRTSRSTQNPERQLGTPSDETVTPGQSSMTTASRPGRQGGNRGFLVPGDNLLKDTLTPWGLTILGFAVSICGVVYQSIRHR